MVGGAVGGHGVGYLTGGCTRSGRNTKRHAKATLGVVFCCSAAVLLLFAHFVLLRRESAAVTVSGTAGGCVGCILCAFSPEGIAGRVRLAARVGLVVMVESRRPSWRLLRVAAVERSGCAYSHGAHLCCSLGCWGCRRAVGRKRGSACRSSAPRH